jgi:hypothetical protein
MNSNNHPIYGTIEYNVWKPLYFHKTNKKTNLHEFGNHPNYEILFIDNKDTPFIIRNKKRKRTIKSRYGNYTLSKDGVNTSYSEIHIAVASAFPHITPKYSVDHINDHPNDNRITNLMWMDQSENSKKGQKKSVENSNANGGRYGKYVTIRKPDSTDKTNRDKSIPIGVFRSLNKCAQFIIDNVIQKDKKPKLGTVAAKINRATHTPRLKAYGYYYDSFEINVEYEEWKNHPEFTEYQVSTHGRFRNSHGIISRQKKVRNGAKYSQVSCKSKNKYIHKLVWETWIGHIPEGMDIMHDDKAPLCQDGSYRNWLCDLSLGTRKENMISFHKHKSTQETQQYDKFVEKVPDVSILLPKREFPDNILGDLMRNAPQGIQFIQAKNRGNKYVLSRLFSTTGKDMSSTGKKNVSDEEKFLEVLQLYQTNCVHEKQDKKYMAVNIEDYLQYLPES